ncbi:MAG: LysM peptidoglycan-binding domain-containing protein [Spirochaetaceae bacterium]|nr:LysM peptidoglycan-binding domain-containing protein [Spirochaetaceae bacterium]
MKKNWLWPILLTALTLAPVYGQSRVMRPLRQLPLSNHQLVLNYIEHYSQPHELVQLSRTLARAEGYISHISARLTHYGLPAQLIYLPLIESSFRADAVSHSGAVGLWQFIEGAAAVYGLVMDNYRDDRRDFYLATEAALQKISDEYRLFGDILLAIAAYNGGIGRVRAAIEACAELGISPTFWNMLDYELLPAETMHYVPRLLAISYVAERERKAGTVPALRSYQWLAGIPAEPGLSLANIAERAGINLDELMANNYGLNSAYLPPAHASRYLLKAPTAQLAGLRLAMIEEALEHGQQPVFYHIHRLTPGDSLRLVARSFGLNLRELLLYNPHLNGRVNVDALVVAPKKNVVLNGYHIVQQGENLWRISLRFGLRVSDLAYLNNLEAENVLRPGTRLLVPL